MKTLLRIHIFALALVALVAIAPLCAWAQAQSTSPAQTEASSQTDTQATQKGDDIPNTPAKVTTNTTPVAVVHGNVDQLGTRLAFHLKELFNTSSLFTLTSGDKPMIKVMVTTKPEFPGRPQVGSVYSAVWIFSSGENVLTHYLANEAGTVDNTTVDATAEALAATTAAVAEKYAYLFE